MKRRSFLTGLLASSALLGVTLKSDAMNIIKSKTEDEQFYEFFEKFNGFPINSYQQMMYIWYKNDYGIVTLGRQMGVSTFLITLAAFLNKTKHILHVSTNYRLAGYIQKIYLKNNNGRSNGVYFGWADQHGGKETDSFFDMVLYDNSGGGSRIYDKFYDRTNKGKFMLGTTDYKSDFELLTDEFPKYPKMVI
jgi:hypothetical protein